MERESVDPGGSSADPGSMRSDVSEVHRSVRALGMDGLSDKRLTQASFRRAPVDEVMAVADRYKSRYQGWNVKHFYSKYRKDGGQRSYSWVKNTLQSRGLVPKVSKRGVHRKHREQISSSRNDASPRWEYA